MEAKDLGYIVTDYLNSKGESVSPKKLQKLLYYVESWNLVHLGTPLLEEDFEAWVHGPVLPSVYRELKQFGFNNISIINDELDSAEKRINKIAESNNLSGDQKELIFSVLNKYGGLSPFDLEMLTHSEKPWVDARGNVPPHENCNNIISKESMRSYYSSLIR